MPNSPEDRASTSASPRMLGNWGKRAEQNPIIGNPTEGASKLAAPRGRMRAGLLESNLGGANFRLRRVSEESGHAVRALKDRILQEGRNLGRGILKVDSFLNHQVDAALIDACGRELATRLRHVGATKVLTAEISGIAPAVTTALHLQVPLVYARRTRPVTMPDQVLLTVAPSHTRGQLVELIVSPEYLQRGERVLIVDDFLATGQTILGLARLVQAGGAVVVGIGTVIEKSFERGREALIPLGVPVESLAIVTDMRDGQIVLA